MLDKQTDQVSKDSQSIPSLEEWAGLSECWVKSRRPTKHLTFTAHELLREKRLASSSKRANRGSEKFRGRLGCAEVQAQR